MAAIIPRDRLAKWAEALEASGEYKVLRHLGKPKAIERAPQADERVAVIVDTETTGLDLQSDEVIELGMLAFTYSIDGRVEDIVDTFDELQEPTRPLTTEISAITGLTVNDLRGNKINISNVEDFVSKADIIIAHNAAFDRPFCERISPVFKMKPWACSATEIPWKLIGFGGVKLEYLLTQCGYFYSAHRALDDSFALFRVLSHSLTHGPSPFVQLLESARKPTFRIRFSAPFEVRDRLRSKGYRWNAHPDPSKRHWYIDLSEDSVEDELGFVRSIKQIDPRSIVVDRFSAHTRFRLPDL